MIEGPLLGRFPGRAGRTNGADRCRNPERETARNALQADRGGRHVPVPDFPCHPRPPGGAHQIIAKVRYERVDCEGRNFLASLPDGDTRVSDVRTQTSYDFWLAGIHGRHEPMPNPILIPSGNFAVETFLNGATAPNQAAAIIARRCHEFLPGSLRTCCALAA